MRSPAALLAALIVLSVGAAEAAPGELDPAFGRSGKVVTSFGAAGTWGWLNDVAVQSDGKIVAAGGAGPIGEDHFTLARYRSDGRLDPTFGSGGRVKTTIAPRFDEALEVALQPDGKIIAVGGGGEGSTELGIIARYLPDGSLDQSFGAGGTVEVRLAQSVVLRAVALQPDGKIVVVGVSGDPEQVDYHFVVGRYKADGSPDDSFGLGGWTSTSFGDDSSEAVDVVLQPDGKIVAVGSRVRFVQGVLEWRGFALARYRTDGSPDPSFGAGGKVTTVIGGGGVAETVLLQQDGKIVAGGTTLGKSGGGINSTGKLALVRYLPDGSLDSSFAKGGKVASTFGDLSYAADTILLGGGRIGVAVGHGIGFNVARYLPDGKLDRSFGTRGMAGAVFGGQLDVVSALAVQPDGMLVAAGTTYKAESQDFALARFLDTQPICHVPRVKGKRLAEARSAIAHGHCSVGRVRWAFSKAARGRVIAEQPHAGTHLIAGARVQLLVSRGRRARA